MEKQDVLNARDEIRKLQEALRKGEDPGSTDGFRQKSRALHGRGFKRLTASSLAAIQMNKRPKTSLPRSLRRHTRRQLKKRVSVPILFEQGPEKFLAPTFSFTPT